MLIVIKIRLKISGERFFIIALLFGLHIMLKVSE